MDADVTVEAVVGGVSVTGTVRAPWVGVCRRCLGEASGELRVPVRELSTEDGDGDETYPLVAEVVDLEPMAHDAVLLELPQAPLCRADCLGLCPDCGADRNVEACSGKSPADPRWSALGALRLAHRTRLTIGRAAGPGRRAVGRSLAYAA